MRYLAIVTVDGNDADYMTKESYLDERELALLEKVAAAIKAYQPTSNDNGGRHNWTRGLDLDRGKYSEKPVAEKYAGVLTEDEIEEFEENFTNYDYDCEGFHTVVSIDILEVVNSRKLL